MPKVKFFMHDVDGSDKEILIEENCGEYLALKIAVDYDDVEHAVVARKAMKLLDILNKQW